MIHRLSALVLSLALLLSLAPTARAAGARVDLDLSALSGTVVYAQVYNLMVDPTPYLGMTLRIAGWYDRFEDPETGAVYHACIIPDATACCAQGLEFAPREGTPEAFAEPDDYVTVTGRLDTYDEGEYSYLYLADAEVLCPMAEARD